MNILVIGSGGREHAIVYYLNKSKGTGRIFVAPGNGGTAQEPNTQNVDINTENHQEVLDFVKENNVGLVVIGPEKPLVDGVADILRANDILVFGPNKDGAQIEGSKAFSKAFMKRHSIPTADYYVYDSSQREQAHASVDEMGAPLVVKADGLAAGKGVIIAETLKEAHEAVDYCFDGAFGDAGSTIVLEEYLVGPECSLLAFYDGKTMVTMDPAQDHKRIGEGDTGANTGGMGAYSPLPLIFKDEYRSMMAIMEDVGKALVSEGIDYRGVLYGGFMLTKDGPKVLEFNARFGDPETQILLPRLQGDLLDIMLKTARAELSVSDIRWDLNDSVCVVMASRGYPETSESGHIITGIKEAAAIEDVEVFQAGTKLNDNGETVTAGGRVLCVTALAPNFKDAIDKAYEAIEKISFEGAYYRKDIGKKALLTREEL